MAAPNILIIEDSKTFAEYISTIIRNEKYLCTAAGNGKMGCNFLDNNSFNLVLLDMELPDCSGIEILKHIRKTNDQTQLPVIFISSTTNENIITEALALGANDYITKPFSELTLKIKIKNLLQLQHSAMQIKENLKIEEELNLELQKYAKDLKQSNIEKDIFLSVMAHDLKNPFTILVGFSDLLLRNLQTYELQKIEIQ